MSMNKTFSEKILKDIVNSMEYHEKEPDSFAGSELG